MVPGQLLSLVVGAAPLARRAVEVAQVFVADGWDVKVVTSLAGYDWVDHDGLRSVTGRSVAWAYRQSDQPISDPRPKVVVACPLTFNTGNKLAAGTMDNYALGVLCEALGAGVPVIAVPMVNNLLWGHPVWAHSLDVLISAGVRFVDPHSSLVGAPVEVRSGTGEQVVTSFEPSRLSAAVAELPALKY